MLEEEMQKSHSKGRSPCAHRNIMLDVYSVQKWNVMVNYIYDPVTYRRQMGNRLVFGFLLRHALML